MRFSVGMVNPTLGTVQLTSCVCIFLVTLILTITRPACGASIIESRQQKNNTRSYVEIPFQVSTYFGEVYSFNCTVGTPPQPVEFYLDLSGSDTIINGYFETWQNGSWVHKNITPPYNGSLSSTYSDDVLETAYGNYTSSKSPTGLVSLDSEYSTDTFTLGDMSLQYMRFISLLWQYFEYPNGTEPGGWINTYSSNYILGLGHPLGEMALWEDPSESSYQTFTQKALNDGRYSYSIWTDAAANKSGHLLLGGINTKRYQGSLTNLPTSLVNIKNQQVQGVFTYLVVNISSITHTPSGTNTQTPTTISIPAPLQSVGLYAKPFALLPISVAQPIWDAVGASYTTQTLSDTPEDIIPIIPCSYLTNTSTLDIIFSGAPNLTLSVPMSALTYQNGSGPGMDEGPYASVCQLAIRVQPPGQISFLSSGMMRGLYTVFDLVNEAVSVGLTDFEATEDDVVEIPAGGLAALSNGGSPHTNSGNGQITSGGGSENSGMWIGIGVGIPGGLIMVGCLIALFKWRRRRERRRRKQLAGKTPASTPFLEKDAKTLFDTDAPMLKTPVARRETLPEQFRKQELDAGPDVARALNWYKKGELSADPPEIRIAPVEEAGIRERDTVLVEVVGSEAPRFELAG